MYMKIEWVVKEKQKTTVKAFLQNKNISKRILAKVKFQGGRIEVNGQASRVRTELEEGDTISITLPIEESNETLIPSYKPISILYEDDHYLLVNKPAGIASVPSPVHRLDTMTNRVKGYIEEQAYLHQTIHVVSRLDRETSGVMIFAKHTLAHSYLDALLKDKSIHREYVAFAEGHVRDKHGFIDEPISRSEESIIKRKVHESGKQSMTEYWVKNHYEQATELKVQLHTGRTHQIRVHFAHIGHPLVGETLYKDSNEQPAIDRQALHCFKVRFVHPFSGVTIEIIAPLPGDLTELKNHLRGI